MTEALSLAWTAGVLVVIVAGGGVEDLALSWVVLAVMAWLHHDTLVGLAILGLVAILVRWQESRPAPSQVDGRDLLIKFWRLVSVYLSAGLSPWQAIDAAALSESSLVGPIGELAESIQQRAYDGGLRQFAVAFPGPEAPMIGAMIQHGYKHGLRAEDVMWQADAMTQRRQSDEAVVRRRDPIWLTWLPAILLLNVVWIFMAPMATMLKSTWLKL